MSLRQNLIEAQGSLRRLISIGIDTAAEIAGTPILDQSRRGSLVAFRNIRVKEF